jgi:hypothetical protein
MFGLQIVTKKKLAQIEIEAQDRATAGLVALLKKKDKIFTGSVVVTGDNQSLIDCVFLGTVRGDKQ